MGETLCVRLLVALLLFVVRPGGADLSTAARSGRSDELTRVARRLGGGGLAPLIASPDTPRAERMSALYAASTPDDAWVLLEPLVIAMASPDRPIAAAAARAAARIARALDADAIATNDIPPDDLQATARMCAALARRTDLWPDVRVEAIECAEGLAAALGEDAPPETTGLGDGADF